MNSFIHIHIDFRLDVQNFDWELVQDERRKKIVELCANQCVLYQDSCDAFYVKLKGFHLK